MEFNSGFKGLNDCNTQAKVSFLKPIVKCVKKIINFHGTCTCTEEYYVDLGLCGVIWKLASAGFCIRRMWRYYSLQMPRVVSPVRRVLAVQIKRAKNGRRLTTQSVACAHSPCCTSFQRRSTIVKSIIRQLVVVKGKPFP